MSKHRICEVADVRSEKVHIIAEAGVNHNGDSELAFKLIEAAAKAGADSIKFQTFKRPGEGLSPMYFWDVLGKEASRSFSVDEPISL